MEKFHYLQKNEHFKECNEYDDTHQYILEMNDKNVAIQGMIFIPVNEQKKLSWTYREVNYEINKVNYFLDSDDNSLEELPKNWFFKLLIEVDEKVQKRDRLRTVFQDKS